MVLLWARVGAILLTVDVWMMGDDSNGNFTTWTIPVSTASVTLKVQAVFTSLLTPYPAEITQMESQLVQLQGSHYFFSPYATSNQKSVVKLASATIESFTKVPGHSVRGSSIHFGPFKDVAAFEVRKHSCRTTRTEDADMR